MKFGEMQYQRPDMSLIESEFRKLLAEFDSASFATAQAETLRAINEIRYEFRTMASLSSIRNSIDTQDAFYKEEKTFFDENSPTMEGLEVDYYRALTSSKFRSELENEFGRHMFLIAELSTKSFDPTIVADLKADNRLSTEYNALIASAQISFRDEVLNLSQIGKYLNDPDRQTRRVANEAKYGFYAGHEARLDSIYDELVHTRTDMAKKLGHENFIQLGYQRLRRTDYGPEQVAKFRAQIEQHVVPLAQRLKERQRQRIGVNNLRYYDEGFNFTSGNPVPKGDADWILANGRRMYSELSKETDEFFSFMTANDLMDLLSRKGKRVGGYCSRIPKYKAPFIFANFNGTAHDVTVLTHEAGHAFMGYCARSNDIPEYGSPTLEAAEIHSMSMEFFTWPWMESFFAEDTDKFKFYHLSSSITGLPYLVTVDEFQHFVYANPNATPEERKRAWRSIEHTYLPQRDYEDNAYLERGTYWQQQLHIFGRPFYYIDYALAQICALQFWQRMREDRDAAWTDYLHLCKLAGSKSFVDLVAEANLVSPFEDGCVESVVADVEAWLDRIDDGKL